MKSFTLNNRMQIIAKSEKTRSGFRHRATLMVDGRSVDEATANYLNRTWESYEYESVINKLIDKSSHISPVMKQKMKDKLAGKSHQETQSQFKTIGMVAGLGDIFGKTPKEKVDWKARMIKAGLGNQGLQMPSDWETLGVKEQNTRLNKVIGMMGGGMKSKVKTKLKKKKSNLGSADWVKKETQI